MKLFKGLLWLIFSLVTYPIFAQQDTVRLKDVTIIGNRLHVFNNGNVLEKPDSTILYHQRHLSFGEYLGRHSTIFIKTNAPGMLASTSLRGSGASHTAVLWNGFNLQSSMNGQIDLSLLPVQLVEEIDIQKGGSSALFGSGAIGGTLHLNNTSSFNSGFNVKASQTSGSFGRHQQFFKASFGGKRIYSSVKVFHLKAQNDFSFVNRAEFGKPTVQQTNNSVLQYGTMLHNSLKINHNQNLQVNVWYQNTYRQIPPSMTMRSSYATQKDESLRTSAEYQILEDKYKIFIRSAYLKNELIYKNSPSASKSQSSSESSISETEINYGLLKNFTINHGINYTYHYAFTGGYGKEVDQNRIAGFSSVKYQSNSYKLTAILNLRQEIVDGDLIPFTPSLGIDYIVDPALSLKGNLSRSYRIPTFNDLYWVGIGASGNPDLEPEDGMCTEAGFNYSIFPGLGKSSLGFTAFSNLVDNWINWEPVNGVWMPRNIMKVWARGVESNVRHEQKRGDIKFVASLSHSYTKSTVEESSEVSSLKKQLMYVPLHTGTGFINVSYQSYGAIINQSYTGFRFTASDNKGQLPAFSLTNLKLYKSFYLIKNRFDLGAEVNNLFNTSYEIMAFNAMPGRNYQFTLNVSFHKPNQYKDLNEKY
jgi:vitamin B12 transporter